MQLDEHYHLTLLSVYIGEFSRVLSLWEDLKKKQKRGVTYIQGVLFLQCYENNTQFDSTQSYSPLHMDVYKIGKEISIIAHSI